MSLSLSDAAPDGEPSAERPESHNSCKSQGAATPPPAAQPAQRGAGKGGRSADSAQTRFRHALQLKTVEEGYNSGRTYYLQAASEDQCLAVCESIAQLARLAREELAARSRFGRFQNAVLVAYESTPFQSAVAILILAVRRGGGGRRARRAQRRRRVAASKTRREWG